MILTVTPNPTLDRAVFVREFRLGAIVRGERELLTPSGKGVDASLVLQALGRATLATGLQAGRQGRLARDLLDQHGIPHDFVEAEGETRHALVLIDTTAHSQSTISVSTLRANAHHLDALLALLDRRLPAAHYAVLAGSLPPGWPADAYRPMIARCRMAGVPTLLDTSGAALSAALAGGGTMPDIVKVNLVEFGSIRSESAGDQDARQQLSDDLSVLSESMAETRERLGLAALVVTLGARGALAASADGIWHAAPPPVEVVNDAGAGDALAAGLVAALTDGQDWPSALRLGTACAAATVTTPGTAECEAATIAELLDLIEVRSLGLLPSRDGQGDRTTTTQRHDDTSAS